MQQEEFLDLEFDRHALRSFRLSDKHLYPIAKDDDSWADGTCVARCLSSSIFEFEKETHEVPAMGCHCGVYGTLSLYHLHAQYPSWTKGIVAVIAVEGATILGSKGLRTASARVVAYWGRKRSVRGIAKRQFKDAVRFRSLKKMLKAYGLPIISEEELADELRRLT